MRVSERFVTALTRAVEIHGDQLRKRTEADPEIPYVAHLLNVCGLVLQDGGSEDEAIAALLHDAAEDRGGEARLAEIEREFGSVVSRIVAECSDTFETPKPPWRERKESYIAHLRDASIEAIRVSVADKLDNARAIVIDYRRLGEELWTRFNPEADQLWYYRSMVDAYREIDEFQSELIDELETVVRQLERMVARNRARTKSTLGRRLAELLHLKTYPGRQ